jgi:hypothetical protein
MVGALDRDVFTARQYHITTTFVERQSGGAKLIALDFFGALPVALDFRSRDRGPPPKVLKVPERFGRGRGPTYELVS